MRQDSIQGSCTKGCRRALPRSYVDMPPPRTQSARDGTCRDRGGPTAVLVPAAYGERWRSPRRLSRPRTVTVAKATAFVLGALLAFAAPCSLAESSGLCDAYLAEWVRVREELVERMDGYARIRDESVTPMIDQEMARAGARASMARVVQSALQERNRRMAESRRKIEEFLGQERDAFERWRLCTTDGRRRSGGTDRTNPEIRDRERVLARLNDLLLDEAYVQYKDHRERVPTDGSSYDSTYASRGRGRDWTGGDQPAVYNDRSRYGFEGYGGQWNRFRGYFR